MKLFSPLPHTTAPSTLSDLPHNLQMLAYVVAQLDDGYETSAFTMSRKLRLPMTQTFVDLEELERRGVIAARED